jgi:hypothetical protein
MTTVDGNNNDSLTTSSAENDRTSRTSSSGSVLDDTGTITTVPDDNMESNDECQHVCAERNSDQRRIA